MQKTSIKSMGGEDQSALVGVTGLSDDPGWNCCIEMS